METRDYVCVCHGCGKFHIVKSYFMSVPQGIEMNPHPSDTPDTRWIIPNHACPECMIENKKDGRIQNAYRNGMTPEATARANSEFVSEWRDKILVISKARRY